MSQSARGKERMHGTDDRRERVMFCSPFMTSRLLQGRFWVRDTEEEGRKEKGSICTYTNPCEYTSSERERKREKRKIKNKKQQ